MRRQSYSAKRVISLAPLAWAASLAVTAPIILGSAPALAQSANVGPPPPTGPALEEARRLLEEAFRQTSARRHAEAGLLFRRVLEVCERLLGNEHPDTLMALRLLAESYRVQGRYAEAEPLFRRALEASERVFGREHPTTLDALNNLAVLYNDQGRYIQAEPLLRRALETRERVLGRAHRSTLISVNNLAEIYRAQDRHTEAAPLYRRTLEALERLLGREHPTTLIAVNNLALLSQEQGRDAEAEQLHRRALEAREQARGREHPDTIVSANNLAGLYLLRGRFDEAQPLFRRVLEAQERVLGRSHPLTLVSAENLIIAQLRLADSAQMAIIPATQLVTGVRQRRSAGGRDQQFEAQRQREASDASRYLSLFADAAWSAGGQEHRNLRVEAFATLQESLAGAASRAIAEQAAQRYAVGRDPALPALIRERLQRQDEWSELDQRLAQAFSGEGEAAGDQPSQLNARMEHVRARLDTIERQLQQAAPDYFRLIQPRPVGVDAARALLRQDEAIMMVVPSRFGTHVMVVTSDQALSWHRSGWTGERIARAVRRLRWDAGARVSPEEVAQLSAESPTGALRFDRTTAHDLYRELIAPVLPGLAGKTRLFIAAGGPLAGLPFSLLVSHPPVGDDADPQALRATRWFSDAFELTHIPSIQSIAILRGQRAPASGGAAFVGVGDPVLAPITRARGYGTMRGLPSAQQFFERGRTRQGTPADLSLLRALPSLPGTAAELRAVQQNLGAPASSLYTQATATEPTVRNIDYRGARVVLFSTHALTSDEAIGTGEPGLVLTPPPDTGQDFLAIDPADDGYLAASEVTTLRMDTEWVVLSACNTATGDDNANLSALARAFFFAGARNLLASHWPVSDDAAPLLVTRALAPGLAGLSRGAALQRAMRSIREDQVHPEWAHPFYWAPFVLIGDGAS